MDFLFHANNLTQLIKVSYLLNNKTNEQRTNKKKRNFIHSNYKHAHTSIKDSDQTNLFKNYSEEEEDKKKLFENVFIKIFSDK